jgi:hypothetical protein
MGQEAECRMRSGRRSLAGKAYLETDFVLFRGDERVKVALKDLTSVKASAGVLRLEFAGGPLELELGRAAEKWADRILHPRSRLDKLGVSEGTTVRVVGELEVGFAAELEARGAQVVGKGAEIVFFAAENAGDLKKVGKLAPSGSGALWVVYPKGAGAIREMDVLEAGRAAGLKDVKVASFSATHTALKFVLPKCRR